MFGVEKVGSEFLELVAEIAACRERADRAASAVQAAMKEEDHANTAVCAARERLRAFELQTAAELTGDVVESVS